MSDNRCHNSLFQWKCNGSNGLFYQYGVKYLVVSALDHRCHNSPMRRECYGSDDLFRQYEFRYLMICYISMELHIQRL